MYSVTLRRVRESLLLWKSNKCYIVVSVCARVGACALVCVPGRVGLCMCARACSFT